MWTTLLCRYLYNRKIGPALAIGNSIVLKVRSVFHLTIFMKFYFKCPGPLRLHLSLHSSLWALSIRLVSCSVSSICIINGYGMIISIHYNISYERSFLQDELSVNTCLLRKLHLPEAFSLVAQSWKLLRSPIWRSTGEGIGSLNDKFRNMLRSVFAS